MTSLAIVNHFNTRFDLVTRMHARTQECDVKLGRALLIFTVLVLSLIYVFEVNMLATNGYRIRALEEKRQVVIEANKQLEMQLLDLRSVANQRDMLAAMKFVDSSQVEYYVLPPSSVAISK
jgi:hypothetical protein